MKYLLNNAIKQTKQQWNLNLLNSNIAYHGFGNDLSRKIEAKLKEDPGKFQVHEQRDFQHPGLPKQTVDFTLFFKKPDSQDYYHFYAYRAKMGDKSQMFRPFDGLNFTPIEAYNLLGGRAVNKIVYDNDEPSHNAWFQLSNKDKDDHGNFRFDVFQDWYHDPLENAIDKYPIKEIEDWNSRRDLVQKLYLGNMEQVTLTSKGKEEKFFVTAAPKDDDFNFFDSKLTPQNRNDLRKEGFRVKADEEPKKSMRRGMGI